MATVLIVSDDLMFSSQASAAVNSQRFGCETLTVMEQVACRVSQGDVTHIVLDLNLRCDALDDWLAKVRRASPVQIQIIAVGPHVHQQRLEAASAAGCDQVMTRGQFHRGWQPSVGE